MFERTNPWLLAAGAAAIGLTLVALTVGLPATLVGVGGYLLSALLHTIATIAIAAVVGIAGSSIAAAIKKNKKRRLADHLRTGLATGLLATSAAAATMPTTDDARPVSAAASVDAELARAAAVGAVVPAIRTRREEPAAPPAPVASPREPVRSADAGARTRPVSPRPERAPPVSRGIVNVLPE